MLIYILHLSTTGRSTCVNIFSIWYTSVCFMVYRRDVYFELSISAAHQCLCSILCSFHCLSVVVSSGINSFVYGNFCVHFLDPFVSITTCHSLISAFLGRHSRNLVMSSLTNRHSIKLLELEGHLLT